MNKFQKKLFDTLVKIDKISRNNNINYSLHGGTLLGAVRNGSFISWDNDSDITMSRKDYELFKKIINNNDYGLKIDREHYWITRIHNTENDTLVDLFIWDYISSNRIVAFIKINTLRFLQGTFKTKKDIETKEKKFLYLIALYFTCFIGSLLNKDLKIKIYDYVSKNFFLGKKNLIHRSNDNFNSISYIFDSNFICNLKEAEFENYNFLIYKDNAQELKKSYGVNYMTPIKKK